MQTPGSAGPDAVPAVLYVGMMRVHMTLVTTVGLPLDSVTPPQKKVEHVCAAWGYPDAKGSPFELYCSVLQCGCFFQCGSCVCSLGLARR
jgi:hypothetical protein